MNSKPLLPVLNTRLQPQVPVQAPAVKRNRLRPQVAVLVVPPLRRARQPTHEDLTTNLVNEEPGEMRLPDQRVLTIGVSSTSEE